MKAPLQPLRVAVAQMTSVDSLDRNLDQILGLLAQIKEPVDLVSFPENSLFFRLQKRGHIPALNPDHACFTKIQAIVEERGFDLLLGSAPMANEAGGLGNSTVHFTPGEKPKIVYQKIHLFDVDVAGSPPVMESDSFVHGETPHVLEVKSWRIGLSICYDLRFAELYSKYAKEGVHLIMVPSAFLVPTGLAHWHILLRARAIESQAYVVAAAQAGEHIGLHDERRHTYGHSLAIDPWGEVLCDLGESGTKVGIVTLDPKKLEKVWRQIPQAEHRRLR